MPYQCESRWTVLALSPLSMWSYNIMFLSFIIWIVEQWHTWNINKKLQYSFRPSQDNTLDDDPSYAWKYYIFKCYFYICIPYWKLYILLLIQKISWAKSIFFHLLWSLLYGKILLKIFVIQTIYLEWPYHCGFGKSNKKECTKKN